MSAEIDTAFLVLPFDGPGKDIRWDFPANNRTVNISLGQNTIVRRRGSLIPSNGRCCGINMCGVSVVHGYPFPIVS